MENTKADHARRQITMLRRQITMLRIQKRRLEYLKFWTNDSRKALEMARDDIYSLENEGQSLEGYAGVPAWSALSADDEA